MKFTLNILDKRSVTMTRERRWPSYMFGGRMRTSTLVLIVVFLLVWWIYDTYGPMSRLPRAAARPGGAAGFRARP